MEFMIQHGCSRRWGMMAMDMEMCVKFHNEMNGQVNDSAYAKRTFVVRRWLGGNCGTETQPNHFFFRLRLVDQSLMAKTYRSIVGSAAVVGEWRVGMSAVVGELVDSVSFIFFCERQVPFWATCHFVKDLFVKWQK